MRRARRLACTLLAASTAACGAGEPSSEVTTEEDGIAARPTQGIYGQAPAAVGGVPSVILLTSTHDAASADAAESSVTIDQFGLTFSPTLVTTRLNTPVVFTNSESAVAHNVRVRALGDTADVIDADANPGERLTVELTVSGGYDVLCDMHPGMTAFIFASDASYSVFADADGAYLLDGVPAGTYTIQLWTAESGFHEEQSLEVGTGSTGIDLETSG